MQKCVVGGKCGTAYNKRIHFKGRDGETCTDYDGVSLYPSAMVRLSEELGGILFGKPKVI